MRVTIKGYLIIIFTFFLGLEGYAQIKLETPRTRKTNFDIATATLNLVAKDAENTTRNLRPGIQVLDSNKRTLSGFPTKFQNNQETLNLPIYKKYNIRLSLTDYEDTTFSYDLTGTQIAYQASRQILLRPKRASFGLKIKDIETGNDLPINIVLNNKNRNEQITLNDKDRKNGIYSARVREKGEYEIEIKDGKNLSIYKGRVNPELGRFFVISTKKIQGFNVHTVHQFKRESDFQKAQVLAASQRHNFSLNVQDLETSEDIKAGAVFTNKNRNEQIIIQATDGSGRTIKVSLREGDEYNMEVNASKNYFFHTEKVKITSNAKPKAVTIKLTKLKTGAKLALKDIYFDFNSAALKDSSFIELSRVVKMLNSNPKVKLSIEAHTDNVGRRSKNLKLSDRRAKSVADYLEQQNITKVRLITRGFGEDRPLVPNTTAKNKAKNRRVELRVLKSN